jgi:hypothetical protein
MKKEHTLTFYRKMANTNTDIMKKYKSALINSMTFKQIVKIYSENNIKFEDDIDRLIKFKEVESNIDKIKDNKIELNIDKIKVNNIFPYYSYDLYDIMILHKYPALNRKGIIYSMLKG